MLQAESMEDIMAHGSPDIASGSQYGGGTSMNGAPEHGNALQLLIAETDERISYHTTGMSENTHDGIMCMRRISPYINVVRNNKNSKNVNHNSDNKNNNHYQGTETNLIHLDSSLTKSRNIFV